MIYKLTHRFIFFALLLMTTLLPLSAQERPTPPPPDRPVLTTEQMRNARVVSDMRATNRVMVRPNETVVYRLADCDISDRNAPCYIAISASISDDISQLALSDKNGIYTKNLSQSINRGMILQCSADVYSGAGGSVSGLVQRVGVTFHTNDNRTPLTLNWGDTAGTWAGFFFKWNSISGPNPNPGWGSYTNSQAFVNTTGFGETGIPLAIGWVTLAQRTVSVGVNSSGWWCF